MPKRLKISSLEDEKLDRGLALSALPRFYFWVLLIKE